MLYMNIIHIRTMQATWYKSPTWTSRCVVPSCTIFLKIYQIFEDRRSTFVNVLFAYCHSSISACDNMPLDVKRCRCISWDRARMLSLSWQLYASTTSSQLTGRSRFRCKVNKIWRKCKAFLKKLILLVQNTMYTDLDIDCFDSLYFPLFKHSIGKLLRMCF